MTKTRPKKDEYAPYAEQYVSLVTGTDILDTLEAQLKQTTTLLSGRSERDGDFRYAPGKWTVKEVAGHVADTERIFAYRALRIARGDATPISTSASCRTWWRNLRTCAWPAWHCSTRSIRKPGSGGASPITAPYRFAASPTSSRVTNFTTAEYSKSGTFPPFRGLRLPAHGNFLCVSRACCAILSDTECGGGSCANEG